MGGAGGGWYRGVSRGDRGKYSPLFISRSIY